MLRCVALDLQTLIPLDPPHGAIEAFVSTAMFEGAVWPSPRTSDGISVVRALERTSEQLRLRGFIFEADQTDHYFWLELHTRGDRVRWSLFYDVIATSPRRARNAFDMAGRPEDIAWQVRLTGEAEARDGALAVTSVVRAESP